MIPTIKFSDGKEFFYEYRDTDVSPAPIMGTHHYHRCYEIYYFIKGECKYFIDGSTYTLIPGDLILIPKNVIHRTLYTASYERRLLNFTSHFIPEALIGNLDDLPYLFRNPTISKEVSRIFDSIEKEYNQLDEYSEEMLTSLVKLLFVLIARSENKANQKGGNSAFVAETVKRISKEFQTDITLSNVSADFSVSPEHLSRTFKKETGFGFNEYLTLVRLQNAEKLLEEGKLKTVSEIAYACGFNDSNYFSDRFKKIHGMSPLKFRQKCRKTIEKSKNV